MAIPNDLRYLVFEVPNFVTRKFCTQMIGRANETGFHAATITTEDGANVVQSIRNNDRVIFDDLDLASTLWDRAKCFFLTPSKDIAPSD